MKCIECGNAMTKSVGDHVYRESGMDHVILRNVVKYSCESCGAKRVQIAAMTKLHRAIAIAIAGKPARLLPNEVRFVRNHLELSNKDFAALMGVTEEQASRWASSDPLGVPAERFLRVLAVLGPEILRHHGSNAADNERLAHTLALPELVRTLSALPPKDEPVATVPIRVRRSDSDWKPEFQPAN